MKNWIQKTLVVAVALLTFGVISPNHTIWENLLEDKANQKTISTQNTQNTYAVEWVDDQPSTFIEDAIAQAKEQSLLKFGSRIGPVITNEFDEIIFPKIQEAIQLTLFDMDNESLKSLAITENPSGDHSEKIFHIYETVTGSDIIRFHVRTDRKPQDGYYFNFHYHTASDTFAKHYTLGDIYWSKNMPPKWLS
ncbi:YpjP family protein [Paenisporosarcina sp. OV554]|uniref:YpjP family protein n=1 Tax=Paenisporosarcina sp. OV554 TaxID=2135694 RepID=UPI000D3CEE6C|nr:YpjP family protein [Paenisporosarcina sp. OV554]PUB13974.1 YpjP-like protein [Paenisporosarcina sp. OV554]